MKVGLRWVKNYADLDFRSLASYTRGDLASIALAADTYCHGRLEPIQGVSASGRNEYDSRRRRTCEDRWKASESLTSRS